MFITIIARHQNKENKFEQNKKNSIIHQGQLVLNSRQISEQAEYT